MRPAALRERATWLAELCREGWKVNHKRVYRLYKLEGLVVRTKKRKKRGSHLRIIPALPTRANER